MSDKFPGQSEPMPPLSDGSEPMTDWSGGRGQLDSPPAFVPPNGELIDDGDGSSDQYVAPLVHPETPPAEQVADASYVAVAPPSAAAERQAGPPKMPQEVLKPLREFMAEHANGDMWVRGTTAPMGLREAQNKDAEGNVTSTEIMIASHPDRSAWVVDAESGEFHEVPPQGFSAPETPRPEDVQRMVQDTAAVLSWGYQQGFYTQRDPAKRASMLGKDHQRVSGNRGLAAAHASRQAAKVPDAYSEAYDGKEPEKISSHDLELLRDFVYKYAGEHEEPIESSDGGVYTHSIVAQHKRKGSSHPTGFAIRRVGEGDDTREEIVISRDKVPGKPDDIPDLAVDVKTGQVRSRRRRGNDVIFQPGSKGNVQDAVWGIREVFYRSKAGEGFVVPRNAKSLGSRALKLMGIKPPPYQRVRAARAIGARKGLRGLRKGNKTRDFKV